MNQKTAVIMEHISFCYQESEQNALKDFNLSVASGECVLLCGESGCGKTTVARMVNGLIPHYYEGDMEGFISVYGRNPKELPLESLAGTVGSVFQNPRSQFFCVDTTSEVAFGCENLGLPENEIRSRVRIAAEQTKTTELLGRNIFNLSGGEKQKIACAGIHAMNPEVLVLDEPTSNLDIDAIDDLKNILLLWKRQGKTILIAEHRLWWLRDICDRVFYLRGGTNAGEFTAEEFFKKSKEELNQMGLRTANEPMNLLESEPGFFSLYERQNTAPIDGKAEDLLELRDFRYCYGKRQALNIPCLEVPKCAVVAVIGHNGAGKSTFANCLCGLKKGFKGKVAADGKTCSGKEIRRLSYMVMQDVNHQLFSESVMEEVMLGMREEDIQSAEYILTRLDLISLRERHPMSLSGGQKQRTAIAAAMLSDRPVLILDEPTSGLDFRHMEETAMLIQMASEEKTVFIVTHDMELIDLCCTHVLHIENGQLLPCSKDEKV